MRGEERSRCRVPRYDMIDLDFVVELKCLCLPPAQPKYSKSNSQVGCGMNSAELLR